MQQASIWRSILNLRADWASTADVWRASVWVKNLTQERPVLHAADVTVLLESLNDFLNNPNGTIFLTKYYPERTVGVTVSRTF